MSNRFIIFTSPTCSPCRAAKKVLDREGIGYEAVDLTEDEAALARLKTRLQTTIVQTPMFSYAGELYTIVDLRSIINKIQEARAA